jgi:D-aspartate ligase
MTPALVLGGEHTGLSVMRALARHGIPQFAVGASRSFVAYSRCYRRLPSPGGADPTPASLSAFLGSLSHTRMVLMPCSDAWVAAVAALEPGIAARFPASIPSRDSVDICVDKARFAEMLERVGLPHPRTVRVDDPDQVPTLWDGFRHPFLKPRNSLAFRARFGVKARRVTTSAEAVIRAREAQEAGLDLLLQEFIPGPATSHYFVDGFVDREGTVRAWFARRRVRSHTEPFGDSSCMVSIPLGEACAPVETVNRLLEALPVRGIFNAQFKYDERDGLYKLLDFNPRPWGGVTLPISCGVDVVEMAYRDALGLPVETVTDYPIGRHWVHHARDFVACVRLLRERRLSLASWVRTWAGAVHPIFRWNDPLPAAAMLLQTLKRRT